MASKNGPGKYDPECTGVLLATGAVCTVLMVIAGDRGTGFSVSCANPEVLKKIPDLLRSLANSIESADN